MSDSDSITIIGRGAHIKGEITLDTPARILGTIEGTVYAKTEMYIGETAHCKAAVHGTSFLVDGVVEGSLVASERVELTAKCCVKGDITAAALVVADGASFMGYCRVGPEAMTSPIANQPANQQINQQVDKREQAPPALQMTQEHPAREQKLARPSVLPERIVIADRPGVEVKTPGGLSHSGAGSNGSGSNGSGQNGTTGITQPRPRTRTADWLPPTTPAFPTVVTKTNDWNGSTASA